MSKRSHKVDTKALRALQRECEYKRERLRIAYSQGNRGPAQRITDHLGRVTYRPWVGVTGGKWIKGAPVIGAQVKQFFAPSTSKEPQ